MSSYTYIGFCDTPPPPFFFLFLLLAYASARFWFVWLPACWRSICIDHWRQQLDSSTLHNCLQGDEKCSYCTLHTLPFFIILCSASPSLDSVPSSIDFTCKPSDFLSALLFCCTTRKPLWFLRQHGSNCRHNHWWRLFHLPCSCPVHWKWRGYGSFVRGYWEGIPVAWYFSDWKCRKLSWEFLVLRACLSVYEEVYSRYSLARARTRLRKPEYVCGHECFLFLCVGEGGRCVCVCVCVCVSVCVCVCVCVWWHKDRTSVVNKSSQWTKFIVKTFNL